MFIIYMFVVYVRWKKKYGIIWVCFDFDEYVFVLLLEN